MSRRVFDVTEEPRHELLHRMMRALAQRSSSAMLVLRDDLELSEPGRALVSRLHPHLVEQRRSSSWPGTNLLSEEATVLRFAMNDAVLDELLGATEGLYGWQQPALPEDLALIRQDGTVLLGSICHEHDAYLELTDEEYGSLIDQVPEIAEIVRPRA